MRGERVKGIKWIRDKKKVMHGVPQRSGGLEVAAGMRRWNLEGAGGGLKKGGGGSFLPLFFFFSLFFFNLFTLHRLLPIGLLFAERNLNAGREGVIKEI